jgi:tRNA uridine 5-carboxymethylaminomethyl modification enzyme
MAIFNFPEKYSVIVIGAGHAGCEAAHITAKLGLKTLLITQNLDTIAQMSCNPSIGGVGKGQIVKEIDALGGIMGIISDQSALNYHMLNTSRGPAVQSPRAQCDKKLYHINMKKALENTKNLHIIQDEARELIINGSKLKGVLTERNTAYLSDIVIITAGTFMKGVIHIGLSSFEGGRYNDPPSRFLSENLKALGFNIKRLKTGTPMRLNSRSIKFDLCDKQPTDNPAEPFSIFTDKADLNKREFLPCWITRTNEHTAEIIKNNLDTSPLYSGKIKSIGPRYCPSIEDKIVKFPHHKTHHIFLEPEGYNTNEYYVNGLSTSLSEKTQIEMVKSIDALKDAEIIRMGYAIEYDYADCQDLKFTLESKIVENIFMAGQVNGTTGYEEAAAQGLIAGINAYLKIKKAKSLIIERDEAYIGVMIDDLISKGVDEPYRMFTSRAEFRLMLRQDNAELRLLPKAIELGIFNEEFKKYFENYKKAYDEFIKDENANLNLDTGPLEIEKARISARNDKFYEVYIERNKKEIEKNRLLEKVQIPSNLDYDKIKELSNEFKQKLNRLKPENLYQASRISGITPTDIQLLWVLIEKKRKQNA